MVFNKVTKTNRQAGFTLIELIMVIVILGILSAFALPKFADLTGSAETASSEGARASVKSSAAIAHAQWLANGSTGNVAMEDITVIMVGGYPTGEDSVVNICNAAGLDSAFTCTSTGTGVANDPHIMTIASSGCSFTYTEVDFDGTPAIPAVSAVTCT